MLRYLLVKENCLLLQLDWCSQIVSSGVLSGEVLTICVVLRWNWSACRCIFVFHVAFVFWERSQFLFRNNRQGVGVVGKDIFSGRTISSAFFEHFCFGRLDEFTVFYAVRPPLTFLLKTLHCSYVNCNGFHKRERLFMIMVQQVPKRWNISLNLSEYVLQLSTRWWELSFASAATKSNIPNSDSSKLSRIWQRNRETLFHKSFLFWAWTMFYLRVFSIGIHRIYKTIKTTSFIVFSSSGNGRALVCKLCMSSL